MRTGLQSVSYKEGALTWARYDLGRSLIELKGLVPRGWRKEVRGLGLDPRVASRYMRLASSPLWANGVPEPDLRARLTADLIKLEELSRLTPDQLRHLLDELKFDPSKVSRTRVTDAVRGVLGEPPVQRRVADAPRKITAMATRLPDLVEQALGETAPSAREQCAGALLELRGKVEEALALLQEEVDAGEGDGAGLAYGSEAEPEGVLAPA